MSYSKLEESKLQGVLTDGISGSSQEHKFRRIDGLEELRRRIKSDSIQNTNSFVNILLETAKTHGDAKPESSLIVDSLLLFIKKNDDVFKKVLEGLKGQEGRLLVVFSTLVLKLDHEKKKEAIKPLLHFIVSKMNIDSIGLKEAYDCLIALGSQRLSSKIVEETSQHLDSLRTCPVLFSVKLCSKFADRKLLPKMHKVLERSMAGYYEAQVVEIERNLCDFFQRVADQSSLWPLMELLKSRCGQSHGHITNAIGSILDAHPYWIDDILDVLYDADHEQKLVDAILSSFEKMKRAILDARELLSKIRTNYWIDHPTRIRVHNLLVKGGKSSKPVLFDILGDDEKYDFALWCLKDIGVSNEELLRLFPKPPILQIYDFLYSQVQGRKKPRDLNTLWAQKKKLGENMPGTTNRLEHILQHVFASFNFVTLNVAPLKLESVDIVCFHPETLDLLIVGCTTGILKDDLAKMDASINKMGTEMPDLFAKCTVTPIVVCSKDAAISPSDAKYSVEQGIVILQNDDVDKLLEMLNTNRTTRQVREYIEKCRLRHVDALEDH